MSFLRSIKARVKNQEFNFDLRGLGHEKIIQDKYPWAFLTVKNADFAMTTEIIADHGLHIKTGIDKQVNHIYHDGVQNHQHKTLLLFMAAMDILAHVETAHLLIGQLDSLGERLKCTDEIIPNIYEENSPDYKSWKHTTGTIEVGEASRIYLSHAGIKIGIAGLNRTEVNSVLAEKSTGKMSSRRVA